MEQAYNIKLPLFEGPMDLLLHLIRENKIDIYDIPIALITKQYLEYIELMKELNLEVAGDFLVMAATLIHIKSRMLLPIEETADVAEDEDPRLELVMKLLEYKSFKDAALTLQEREEHISHIHTRQVDEVFEEEPTAEAEPDLTLFDLNLYDLLGAFQRMLEKAPPEARKITREALNIKDKMSMIMDMLSTREAVRFEHLFKGDIQVSHFVVTFIALLELVRLGLARVYQEKEFSTIWAIRADIDVESIELASADEDAPKLKKAKRRRKSAHSDEELEGLKKKHVSSTIDLPRKAHSHAGHSGTSKRIPTGHGGKVPHRRSGI